MFAGTCKKCERNGFKGGRHGETKEMRRKQGKGGLDLFREGWVRLQRWLARIGWHGCWREWREAKEEDRRPKGGWRKVGNELILERGHVSRSQSNTLAEGREPWSGRTSAFGLDNRVTSRILGSIGSRLGAIEEKSSFEVRCPSVMIWHASCRMAKFYKSRAITSVCRIICFICLFIWVSNLYLFFF